MLGVTVRSATHFFKLADDSDTTTKLVEKFINFVKDYYRDEKHSAQIEPLLQKYFSEEMQVGSNCDHMLFTYLKNPQQLFNPTGNQIKSYTPAAEKTARDFIICGAVLELSDAKNINNVRKEVNGLMDHVGSNLRNLYIMERGHTRNKNSSKILLDLHAKQSKSQFMKTASMVFWVLVVMELYIWWQNAYAKPNFHMALRLLELVLVIAGIMQVRSEHQPALAAAQSAAASHAHSAQQMAKPLGELRDALTTTQTEIHKQLAAMLDSVADSKDAKGGNDGLTARVLAQHGAPNSPVNPQQKSTATTVSATNSTVAVVTSKPPKLHQS